MIRLSLFVILFLSLIACSNNPPTQETVQQTATQEQPEPHQNIEKPQDDGMLSTLLTLFDSEELVIAAADEELEPEDNDLTDVTCFDIDCSEVTTQFTYLSNEYHASFLKEEEIENGNDLWARMRSGYGLDLTEVQPRIEVQLQWYKKHQRYIDRTTARSSRYLHLNYMRLVQAASLHQSG